MLCERILLWLRGNAACRCKDARQLYLHLLSKHDMASELGRRDGVFQTGWERPHYVHLSKAESNGDVQRFHSSCCTGYHSDLPNAARNADVQNAGCVMDALCLFACSNSGHDPEMEVALESRKIESCASGAFSGAAASALGVQLLLLLLPVRQVSARETLSPGNILALFYAYLFGCCILAWLSLLIVAAIQFFRALLHVKPEFKRRGWLHFSNSAYNAQGQHLKSSSVRMFWWSFVPLVLYLSAIFVIGRFFPIPE